jgi:hypothetical protein
MIGAGAGVATDCDILDLFSGGFGLTLGVGEREVDSGWVGAESINEATFECKRKSFVPIVGAPKSFCRA